MLLDEYFLEEEVSEDDDLGGTVLPELEGTQLVLGSPLLNGLIGFVFEDADALLCDLVVADLTL